MSRSSWKFNTLNSSIFFDSNLSQKSIKSRFAVIAEADVGSLFYIYNGKSFFSLNIIPFMVGKKFGEFSLTRKYPKVPEKWLKLKKK